MNKVIDEKQFIDLIKDGDTLLVGGFGISGAPLTLIDAIARSSVKDLRVVSNNLGVIGKGLGKLVEAKKIKHVTGTYFTTNKECIRAWQKGEFEIDLIPQGTMAEAIRCGGAGIGGFYTKTAVGTELAVGKEEKIIDGEKYLFQKAIKGDISIIKALKADQLGNLIYDHTARNFNPAMATAGKVVIAEVDEVVETGSLSPFEIVTPHVYVDYIVMNNYVKKGGVYIESV